MYSVLNESGDGIGDEEVWCHFLSLEGIRRLRDNTFLQKKREVIRAATRVDKRTFRVSLIFCQRPFEIWAHSSFDVVYLVLLNVFVVSYKLCLSAAIVVTPE